ncbi:MAG: polysaccharide pyruvyl transferase family protein [Ruminococcus sp.]|nr:polysaccharide pyruvyl transferase family protein [Ruminococcus sp.]
MKKVGIVTYYSIYNYGSVLQAYALNKTVLKLGFSPVLIDHANMNKKWNRKIKRKVLLNRFLQLALHPSCLYDTINIKKAGKRDIIIRSKKQEKKFDVFLKHYFTFPETDYTIDSNYIAFITGSDQVWQFSLPGLNYLFFLRFCPQNKRISYAASFGSISVPSYNRKILHKYLNEFNRISVREKIGCSIVNAYSSKKAKHVLDPVLLVEANFWKDLSIAYPIDNKYIVAYFLSDPSNYLPEIRRTAQYYNAKILWISTGYEKAMKDDIIAEPSPREFLSIINNAKYVCTDSLHGTEFSMVFHKQFTTFHRKYSIVPEQHSRIESLLNMTNTCNRLFYDKDTFKKESINYTNLDKIISKKRNESLRFLIDSLNIIEDDENGRVV